MAALLVFQMPVPATMVSGHGTQFRQSAAVFSASSPFSPEGTHETTVNSAFSGSSSSPSVSGASVTQLNSSFIVSTAGTYGTTVVFAPISGMPSNFTINNNSAELMDSRGNTVAVTNGMFNSGFSGILANFSVTLLGNLSGGPFALSIPSGSSDFELMPAGISSIPSANPALYVFPVKQYSGGHVTIMVSGLPANYNAGYPVIDNTSIPSSHIGTDTNGAGYAGITLPGIPGGNYTVRMRNYMAVEGTGTVVPFMSLIPSSGHVGQDVLALLTGFHPDGTVHITWAGARFNVSGRMNGFGKGVVAFAVPVSEHGSHEIYATSSGQNVSSVFSINQTLISLSASSGSPGMPLSITGTGFVQGDTVRLLVNGHVYGAVSASVAANGSSFMSLRVPALTAGLYGFGLESASGLVSNSTYFTIRPLLVSSVVKIRPGQTVQISGYYFSPNSGVDLFWYSGRSSASVSSGSNGSFSFSVIVPSIPGGPELIGAVDARGNNATPMMIFISPLISSSVRSGFAGQTVVISGSGFSPGSHLSFLWDGNSTGRTAKTNASGSFSFPFVVPASVPGTYILSVNNTSAGQIIFTVLQTVPWTDYLPAIVIPLITGMGASVYLWRRKHRN